MVDDIVREFGYLTLGSRLKRIGERMQADVYRLLKAEGVDVPIGLFPTLGALDRHGELTIGELVTSLGIAQPGVTRNVAQLEAAGLVKSAKPKRDLRQKSVALTKKGAGAVDRTKHDLWPRIERAVANICEGLNGPILAQLDAIEEALALASLPDRVEKPEP